MPFEIPSLSETRDFLVALGKALFPGLNFGSRRSYHGRRATYLAGAVTQLHAHVESAKADVMPDTASDGDPVNRWGSIVGVARKSATPARKASAGRVRGAAGATVSEGAQLRHEESGLVFAIGQAVTVPTSEFYDADIVAVDVGAQTRLTCPAVLKFLETPIGIETTVTLVLDLDEDGFDAEQFGSYRSRVLATFSETPAGGNQSDFVAWALASLNTVASAFAYPERAGRGTIDVVAFYAGHGTARSLSADDRNLVASYIKTKAPFQISGAGGPLRILTTIADPRTVVVTLVPNGQPAFAFDWTEPAATLTVAGWTAETRELQFSASLPLSLRAGHRLILVGVDSRATLHDGREYKIESISGADKVILEKAPPSAPAATDLIFSGGPLVTPVRDAIVAHLNGEAVYAGRGLTPLPESAVQSMVGLDVLAEGIGPANPAGIYGTWAGGILRATLAKIATYKAGVRNAVVVTPAADYEATDDAFPDDAQIHFVTPAVVVVRRG